LKLSGDRGGEVGDRDPEVANLSQDDCRARLPRTDLVDDSKRGYWWVWRIRIVVDARCEVLCPAVIIPITCPAELTSGPPESPGAMLASLRIMPVSCSGAEPPAAVIDCPSATIVPWLTLGAPPAPPALPMASTASPD